MKKLLLMMSMVTAVFAAYAQDTLVLRSGTRVGGTVVKMDKGIITIRAGEETKEYKAGEVIMMMFCSNVKGGGSSCNEGSGSYTSRSSSPGGTPCDVTQHEEKGTVIFECNMCGTKGSLKIYDNDKNEKNTSTVKFSANETGYRFRHKEQLGEGEYRWEYADNRNNTTHGILKIKKGETKIITLFEKE